MCGAYQGVLPNYIWRYIQRGINFTPFFSVMINPLVHVTEISTIKFLDQPLIKNDSYYRFHTPSIGRIVCRNSNIKLMSTATLVEDRHTLLTVSHFNFDDRKNHAVSTKDCEFQFLDTYGRTRFRSGIEVIARGAQGKSLRISRATDWAILRLSKVAPVNRQPLLVDSTFHLNGQTPVNLVGYDSSHKKMSSQFTDRNCDLKLRSPKSIVLEHTCETATGASGAPLIIMAGGHPRVIAIHAARSPKGGVAIRISGTAAQSLADRNHIRLSASE